MEEWKANKACMSSAHRPDRKAEMLRSFQSQSVWMILNLIGITAFLISNLVWLAVSLKDAASGKLKSLAFGAVLLGCWVAAYLFDNAHHGT